MLFLQDLLPHRLSNGVVADIIAKDYPGQTFLGFFTFFIQMFWFLKFQSRICIHTSVRVLKINFLGFILFRHIIVSVAVLRIRIRWIPVFLGLLDPYPDPLVRGTDPDPSIRLSSKNRKNLNSNCFVTSLCLFIFEKMMCSKCSFKMQ
jgi:hypothetical protein